MLSKYKIIIVVFFLLIISSMSFSSLNYITSYNSIEENLKNKSLPLSLNNVYSDIQKNIIKPYLLSSMMSNDIFIYNWLKTNENENSKIKEYLTTYKNKYNLHEIFLISHQTNKYYTHDKSLVTLSEKNKNDKWYFDFLKSKNTHEVNIEFNKDLSKPHILHINYKILDNSKLLGIVGVAIEIKNIQSMFDSLKYKYGFNILFLDSNSNIVLSNNKINNNQSRNKYYKKIISFNDEKTIKYLYKDETYLIKKKYIEEINLYLLVEVKLDDYVKGIRNILDVNIVTSLLIILSIIFILYKMIKKYNKKLENMAYNDFLTGLCNRRHFETLFLNIITNIGRSKENIFVVFLDIDNFKNLNDTLGHNVGDKVLKCIAIIIKNNIRQTDIAVRWGGEEILIVYRNANLQDTMRNVESIRQKIANSLLIKKVAKRSVTASFGVTMYEKNDNIDTIINRADEAMYLSKTNGKNMITKL